MKINYVPTSEMSADILTKISTRYAIDKFILENMQPLSSDGGC
jgi:hypothetical protein